MKFLKTHQLLMLFIGLLHVVCHGELFAQSILDIQDRSQLFVDKVLVQKTERVWFTQHQGKKHPNNPVLKPDRPWEGWVTYIYGDVIYDLEEKIFKMVTEPKVIPVR